jgi:hypothetical protein
MSKLFTLAAALAALFMLSLAGPADAAERKADGAKNAAVGQTAETDFSSHRRRYSRRYYRPYYGYRPYYYGSPYYARPYYGYPYGYYGSPGFGFSFRF